MPLPKSSRSMRAVRMPLGSMAGWHGEVGRQIMQAEPVRSNWSEVPKSRPTAEKQANAHLVAASTAHPAPVAPPPMISRSKGFSREQSRIRVNWADLLGTCSARYGFLSPLRSASKVLRREDWTSPTPMAPPARDPRSRREPINISRLFRSVTIRLDWIACQSRYQRLLTHFFRVPDSFFPCFRNRSDYLLERNV